MCQRHKIIPSDTLHIAFATLANGCRCRSSGLLVLVYHAMYALLSKAGVVVDMLRRERAILSKNHLYA